MTDRKRRKKNKLRGQRTMGAGNTKNRRGAGSRGGRGKAGTNKHRFASIGIFKPVKYRLKSEAKGKEINLGQLDSILSDLVAKGLVTKEGDKFVVTKKSGYAKVLSQGETSHKIILKINASKEAIKKILSKGGKFDFAKKGYKPEEVVSGDEDDEDLEFDSVEGELEEKK
jgi:large subunit ribosomal protein L15